MTKTKGQIKAAISEAIVNFEKEYMGRGPDETRIYLIEDMIVVRLRRVLTPAEKQLASPNKGTRGRALVKQVRTELLEMAHPLLEPVIAEITGKRVMSLHTDISTVTGERIIILILDSSPLPRQEETA